MGTLPKRCLLQQIQVCIQMMYSSFLASLSVSHSFLAGHSKLELEIEQVQSPSARSKEEKTGDKKTLSVLQRRCTALEHRLKQEQDEKRCIQEHSEQLVQDMTTTQLQLEQQLAQEKREAIQAKGRLERQLHHQIQQLQQRLDSATADNQQFQRRLTTANTDNQQLQRRLTTATTDNQQLQQRLTHASAELQSLQDIEPWKISRNKVEIQAEIGVGGWGSVSRGTVRVAVKKLHSLLLSQHNVDRIQREMKMLAQVRHPNLVQFIGVVFDEEALRIQASPMIITELLEMNLRTAYERKLEFNKLSIFQDVAYALNYLHSRHDPIIHRDISAPNVLLEALPNRAWKGKVSDLGSANLAKLARTLAEGAIIYAAPETMPHQAHSLRAPKLPQTTKVDVYSYGVLLCEVATSRFPDPDHYPDMLEQVQREWPLMHGLIISCTQFNPEERPTIADVHSRLSHLSQ